MALRNYILNGLQFQFDEKDAPAEAVPVDAPAKKPAAKRRTTANKARKPATDKAAQ